MWSTATRWEFDSTMSSSLPDGRASTTSVPGQRWRPSQSSRGGSQCSSVSRPTSQNCRATVARDDAGSPRQYPGVLIVFST